MVDRLIFTVSLSSSLLLAIPAYGAPPKAVELTAVSSSPAGTSEPSVWSMAFRFDQEFEPDFRTLRVSTSWTSDLHLPADTSEWQSSRTIKFTLSEPSANGFPGRLLEGRPKLLVVKMTWGRWADADGLTLFYTLNGTRLTPISVDTVASRLDEFEPGITFGPPVPADIVGLPPLEHPWVPDELKAEIREQIEAEAFAAQSGALSASESETVPSEHVTEEANCGAGPLWSTTFLLAMPLLLRHRRRFSYFPFYVSVIATLASSAEARTIVGRVVFWDSSEIGSNVAGSQVPWCDSSLADCSPATSAVCCFRPMDKVTVELKQDGVLLATSGTAQNGIFVLTFNGGDYTKDFSLFVALERPSPAVAMKLTWQNPPLPTSSPVRFATKLQLPSTPPSYTLPDLRLNPAQDVTGLGGAYASAWWSVTLAQRAIELEGDTRYRRLFGEPTTDPDDLILVHVGSLNGHDCSKSLIAAEVPSARYSWYPAYSMGAIYRGRVVGCSTTTKSNGTMNVTVPSFPPTSLYFEFQGGGEAHGLARGLDYLVSHLAFRDPSTLQTLDPPFSVCAASSPHLQNSKDAFHAWNNASALWEWLDTSPVQTQFVDNSDLTLFQVMNALLALKNAPGAGDGQGQEASYATIGAVCNNNSETCSPGHACAYSDPVVFQRRCVGPDPNGSNIEDLATMLDLMAAPGRGNLLPTAESSPCMLGRKDNYPFNLGYVGN